MKVTYKKKAVQSDSRSHKNRRFLKNKKPKPKLLPARSRTVVRVTAVPRRTIRGC